MKDTSLNDMILINEPEVHIPKSFSSKMLFSKLQEYRENNEMTTGELTKKLGWIEQQFYSLNNETRRVRARTLTHVLTKLPDIDPEWLLTDTEETPYREVIKKYPIKVPRWLASNEGREIMLEQYGAYMMQKAKEELAEQARQVFAAN